MPRKPDTSSIIKRDGTDCHYCGEGMNIYAFPTKATASDPMRFTLEHIVPRSDGGSYGLYNLVGAHQKCNNAMGNRALKCFCNICKNARARFEFKELVSHFVGKAVL